MLSLIGGENGLVVPFVGGSLMWEIHHLLNVRELICHQICRIMVAILNLERKGFFLFLLSADVSEEV